MADLYKNPTKVRNTFGKVLDGTEWNDFGPRSSHIVHIDSRDRALYNFAPDPGSVPPSLLITGGTNSASFKVIIPEQLRGVLSAELLEITIPLPIPDINLWTTNPTRYDIYGPLASRHVYMHSRVLRNLVHGTVPYSGTNMTAPLYQASTQNADEAFAVIPLDVKRDPADISTFYNANQGDYDSDNTTTSVPAGTIAPAADAQFPPRYVAHWKRSEERFIKWFTPPLGSIKELDLRIEVRTIPSLLLPVFPVTVPLSALPISAVTGASPPYVPFDGSSYRLFPFNENGGPTADPLNPYNNWSSLWEFVCHAT